MLSAREGRDGLTNDTGRHGAPRQKRFAIGVKLAAIVALVASTSGRLQIRALDCSAWSAGDCCASIDNVPQPF